MNNSITFDQHYAKQIELFAREISGLDESGIPEPHIPLRICFTKALLLVLSLCLYGCNSPSYSVSPLKSGDDVKYRSVSCSIELNKQELRYYVNELGLSDVEALVLLLRNHISLGSGGSYGQRGSGMFRYIILTDGRTVYLTLSKGESGYTISGEEVSGVPKNTVASTLSCNESETTAEGWSQSNRNNLFYEALTISFDKEGVPKWTDKVTVMEVNVETSEVPAVEVAQESDGIIYTGKVPEIFMSILRDIRRDKNGQRNQNATSVRSEGIKTKLEKVDKMLRDGLISNEEHTKLRGKVINEY